MVINIEKRTRALISDPWGAWATTTDLPPYTDTDLIEYRVDSGNTTIDIADITNNIEMVKDGKNLAVTGDGYLDDLMETVNLHLKAQFESGRIAGPVYAQVYVSLFQAAMAQSINFALSKRGAELQADKIGEEVAMAEIARMVADDTKGDKVAISGYKKDVEETNRDIAVGTEADKIALVAQQLAKMTADTSYVGAQQLALEEQVEDNRLIKAIDTIGDTYGTFGAGGITVNADQWGTYYNLIADLTSRTTPNIDVSTITKVS